MPMYSPAMASRLDGLEPSRVERWLQGYEYTYEPKTSAAKGRRRQSPLVRRRGAFGSQYASFVDLIDLLFVKKFVEHGISVQRLRKALEEAVHLTGESHFAQRRFWTDGRKIYLQIKDKPAEALLELLSGGQWVIAPIIKQVAHQIEFDAITGVSIRWFPSVRTNPWWWTRAWRSARQRSRDGESGQPTYSTSMRARDATSGASRPGSIFHGKRFKTPSNSSRLSPLHEILRRQQSEPEAGPRDGCLRRT